MKRSILFSAVIALIALGFTACGGGSSSSSGSGSGGNSQAQVFVTGEDAPVPSVVSFYITINKIMVSNSKTSQTLLSSPITVDFGRLMGLRSLLGFNAVTPDTYTTATFQLSNPVIYFVALTQPSYGTCQGTPPMLCTLNGTLTNPTVTVAFPTGSPLTVASNGLAGLHMDFDLHQSLQTTGGQINGTVNPTIDVQAVSASSELGQISDFTGSVLSTDTTNNTFTVQGPYGFQEVIDVSTQSPVTQFSGGYTLATLPTNAIVSVVGTVQADGSILASGVEVITTDKAFISGRILAINPTGPSVTMFVGEELPNLSPTVPIDTVYTVNLSGVSQYDICFFDNWLTGMLFNANNLVVGQRIFVGGTFQSNVFTPDMVSLRRQGVLGQLVPPVTINSGNQGSFQMQNDLLMSYAAGGGSFTVDTGNLTIFENINGLVGLQNAGAANLVVRGLVFKDPQSRYPFVVAGRVRVLP